MAVQAKLIVSLSSVMFIIITTSATTTGTQTLSSSLLKSSYSEEIGSELLLSLCLNSTTADIFSSGKVICSKQGLLLASGYCATYSESTRLISLTKCPTFSIQLNSYNVTASGYVQLPRDLSQLSDYMCGPLNRKGLVCSECINGFAPSFALLQYTCANCTSAWYGVPLFLVLEFVPITVLYFFILVVRISMTSASMPCFIMYAQFVNVVFYISMLSNDSLRSVTFSEHGDIRLDMKIVHVLYGMLNLDFFQLVLPPFCISSQLKSIHIALFGYIAVLYPMFLIFLTWFCIELHARNFALLVWLWRPFHRCFVGLRRKCDTRSDIVDVFVTFFLLSYCRCMQQTMMILTKQGITNYDEEGKYVSTYHRAVVDLSITYGSIIQPLFIIPSAIIFLTFNVLPPLLLIVYPIRAFRSCLSKCHINFIALHMFVEKINGCYRDGLDGKRDMRSFSGLYFFLRIVVYMTAYISHKLLYPPKSLSLKGIWFPTATVFMITALAIVFIKPYKIAYKNYLDALLLSNLALFCYMIASEVPYVLHLARILFISPMAALTAIITFKMVGKVKMFTDFSSLQDKCCRCKIHTNSMFSRLRLIAALSTAAEKQCLVHQHNIKINNDSSNALV